MLRCPNCGQRFEIVQLPLTCRQRSILDAIARLKRDGYLPTSRVIATRIGIPSATVRVELRALEDRHYVHRPRGLKSGYDTQEPDGIRLLPVSSRAA